jgi:hypothetical protein
MFICRYTVLEREQNADLTLDYNPGSESAGNNTLIWNTGIPHCEHVMFDLVINYWPVCYLLQGTLKYTRRMRFYFDRTSIKISVRKSTKPFWGKNPHIVYMPVTVVCHEVFYCVSGIIKYNFYLSVSTFSKSVLRGTVS